MSQPILLQDEFLGMFRDKSRDQLPKGKCWNLVDYIPEELDAPLSKRGGWSYYGQSLVAIDNLAAAGDPSRVGVAKFQASNEIRRFYIDGATGGVFRFTFSGQTTADITYNASAATVQSALEALSNIAPGDVAVTDNGLSGGETIDVNIQFAGTYAATDIPTASFTHDPVGLSGAGTIVSSMSTLQSGGAAGTVVVAIDDRANPELYDLTNAQDRGSVYGADAAPPLGPMVSYRNMLLIPSPALASSPVGPRVLNSAGVISALITNPPGTRYFAIYKDRVVACSADTDTPNRVFFSGAGDANSWDTTNRWIDTSSPPIAVAPLRNSLLVFHAESVERIRGSIPPGSAAANMELEPLFDNVGLADPFALHVADEFAYWADEDGVYRSDGSSFTDLTKQAGMSSYWRDVFVDAEEVALSVWRGYVWVTLTAADAEVDTLLYHIDKRYWFRFSGILARQFAIVTTDAEDDLIFANRAEDVHRVGSLSSVFDPDSNETDADGGAVIPIIEWGIFSLDNLGQKRWKNIYLTYELEDGAGSAPTFTMSYVQDPASESPTSFGTFSDTGATQARRRIALNRPLRGVGLKAAQASQSAATRVYALEADVQAREGSRRG